MNVEEARQKVREHLQIYVTPDYSEIWIGEVIEAHKFGYTIEAGVHAKGDAEEKNATWFEVDAKSGAVEMCMIG